MKFQNIFNHSGEAKKYTLFKAMNGAPCIEGGNNMEVVSQVGGRTNVYTTDIPDMSLYEVHIGDYIWIYGKSDGSYAVNEIQTYKVTDITDSEVITKPC